MPLLARPRRSDLGFRLTDVTAPRASIFTTTAARSARSICRRRWAPGCAFLDYDGDGWLDILLVNGMDWPGHKRTAQHAAALSQQSQRHVSRMSRGSAGLAVEMYGMGVAVGGLQ